MKNGYFILLVILFIASCKGPTAEFTEEGANYFGAKITNDGAISLSDVSIPQNLADSVEVTLKGTINEVCQAKGCWMTVESAESMDPVFIRFKDYGFFVPKDAGGKEVIVKGKLFTNETSVDELKHYAEDKGASEEEIAAITEPKKEVRMMAEGVIIYNESD